jgi:hypothetical protein
MAMNPMIPMPYMAPPVLSTETLQAIDELVPCWNTAYGSHGHDASNVPIPTLR